MNADIQITGARQHNLKDISVDIPRNALVVITGLSGSGKSSLAFDTLYAEGQRRYVESLSSYARQFLDRLQKPDVDHIQGLSPAIAIEQRHAGSTPRSTVATTTEIHDYLRLLYAHIGTPHCPRCGRRIQGQSAESICDHLLVLPEGTRVMLLAPYVAGKRGEHREEIDRMRRDGFVRARIDGKIVRLDDDLELEGNRKHTLEAVVDRLVCGHGSAKRLTDSVELALSLGSGTLVTLVEDEGAEGGWREEVHSEDLACPDCDISFGSLEPRNFSFNSPYGACSACNGLGNQHVFLPDKVVPDPSKSLKRGAVPLLRRGPRRMIIYNNRLLRRVAEHYGFSLATPWRDLPATLRDVLLHGSGDEIITFDFRRGGRIHRMRKPFPGILPLLQRRYRESESEVTRDRYRQCMERIVCPDCHGARLRPQSLAVTIRGESINALCSRSIDQASAFFDQLELAGEEAAIAGDIVREIRARLSFLRAVGLGYLTLSRESGTLAGGEAQRIRLGTQVGSGLTGVLYILDEPSIGLHQRDNDRLLGTLTRLRDLGNTVIVVEHDLDTIRKADYVIDLGPGAGDRGGELVCAGRPERVASCANSLTGMYLRGERAVRVPAERTAGDGTSILIRGAAEHNLRHIDVTLPLNTFTCVTGVSGSGKSTLVNTVLRNALARHFGLQSPPAGRHTAIEGLSALDKMIVIDQTPIGRTPRSNPATYTGAFNIIRDLFARLPESRMRGYRPGRFSFNVKGGRCEACQGDGIKKIDMQFLSDVYVQCETCQGKRYNRETLTVRYKGRSIADVLEMTVEEGCTFFQPIPALKRKLDTLNAVGLGYIQLGQPAPTLSGGEAQRVKLAAELGKRAAGHTLYILDEPTTGLHAADVQQLLDVLTSLRDQGNTVIVIEHNLDVIKVADHIVDLGPEGGEQGGTVVAAGTPEAVAATPGSHTGAYLHKMLARS